MVCLDILLARLSNPTSRPVLTKLFEFAMAGVVRMGKPQKLTLLADLANKYKRPDLAKLCDADMSQVSTILSSYKEIAKRWPHLTLSTQLEEFFTIRDKLWVDKVLQVDNTSFPAHSFVLRRSQYFRALFDSSTLRILEEIYLTLMRVIQKCQMGLGMW